LGNIKEHCINSSNLRALYLRNNLIKEIVGFDFCPNLVELELYDNRLLEIKGL
jgi:Leucine-rich repeat (LRR) protein